MMIGQQSDNKSAIGYVICCPQLGAILCLDVDSADKVLKLARAAGKWPNAITMKQCEIWQEEGRWATDHLAIK